MDDAALHKAMEAVPAGGWAIGVSGGGDSVALLCLLAERAGVRGHVVHLNHQLRGVESDGDAEFVGDLARRLNVPCTLAGRREVEATMERLPANPSARYRAARLALFRRVIGEHGLSGVILAHQADDQAETVFQRLARGSSLPGLAGIASRSVVDGVTILRPLLQASRADLREYLRRRGQAWREDSSNASDHYNRNVVRGILADRPELAESLRDFGRDMAALREWVTAQAPRLAEPFAIGQLADSPRILAEESARRWLVERGCPPGLLSPTAVERLIEMAADAAAPHRWEFPGRVLVWRRRGMIGTG